MASHPKENSTNTCLSLQLVSVGRKHHQLKIQVMKRHIQALLGIICTAVCIVNYLTSTSQLNWSFTRYTACIHQEFRASIFPYIST